MPASQQGIDIRPDRPVPLDFNEYSKRIKKYGIALFKGDEIMITKIKVKRKHIEFHLGGGGYGTSGDESAHVSTPHLSETQEEKDLKKQIKSEKDPEQKKQLERKLKSLREARKVEQERLKMEAEQTRALKEERIRNMAMQSGSRFNLRYDYNLGIGELKPESVMQALSEYVLFEDKKENIRSNQELYKGMTWEAAAALLGAPSDMEKIEIKEFTILKCIFLKEDQKIEASFVEGILVKYTISSN